MGSHTHTKNSMDAFGMVHAGNMGQKPGLPHHVTGGGMEQLHMPGAGMVVGSSSLHGFGGAGGVATSSAPGKGLGGALMQSPAQQAAQSGGFMGGSQAPMTMQHPTEVSNAGAALSGLDQQSALAAMANTTGRITSLYIYQNTFLIFNVNNVAIQSSCLNTASRCAHLTFQNWNHQMAFPTASSYT